MNRYIELNLKVDLGATGDAAFMDVEMHENTTSMLGTDGAAYSRDLDGRETEALMETARRLAANDNISADCVMQGLRRAMRVKRLSGIQRADFAQAIMTLLRLTEI